MASSAGAWAKAPEFADQPELLARLREQTAQDRREHLEDGLRPVDCRRCGTCVLAKKNSPAHTSIQWRTDPATDCPEFATQAQQGTGTALLDTCPDLQASIEDRFD